LEDIEAILPRNPKRDREPNIVVEQSTLSEHRAGIAVMLHHNTSGLRSTSGWFWLR